MDILPPYFDLDTNATISPIIKRQRRHVKSVVGKFGNEAIPIWEFSMENLKGSSRLATFRELLDESSLFKEVESQRYQGHQTETSSHKVVKQLQLRDIRRMDYRFNQNEELSVRVRRRCVLLSADPIRALITANKLTIFLPLNADRLIAMLREQMSEGIELRNSLTKVDISTNKRNSLITTESFEMLAYETIFSVVEEWHAEKYKIFREQGIELLQYYKKASLIPLEVQKQLCVLKDEVKRFSMKISLFKKGFSSILDDAELLALMNLSVLDTTPYLYSYPLSHDILCLHEEIEENLESYLSDMVAMERSVKASLQQIKNSEEVVKMRLNIVENNTLSSDVMISVVECAILLSTYLVGVFGMNLDQTLWILNDDDYINGTTPSTGNKPFSSKHAFLPTGKFVFVSTMSFLVLSFFTVLFYYIFKRNGVIPSEVV